jgi:hypothetical protein
VTRARRRQILRYRVHDVSPAELRRRLIAGSASDAAASTKTPRATETPRRPYSRQVMTACLRLRMALRDKPELQSDLALIEALALRGAMARDAAAAVDITVDEEEQLEQLADVIPLDPWSRRR